MQRVWEEETEVIENTHKLKETVAHMLKKLLKKEVMKIYSSSWYLKGERERHGEQERWALSVRKADSGLKHTWQSWKLVLERAFSEKWSCWGQDEKGRMQIIEQTRGEATGRSQGKWDKTIKGFGEEKDYLKSQKMWESFKEIASLIFILACNTCSKYYKGDVPKIFIHW